MIILNQEQALAVRSSAQHIFIIAGAGSGKTRVIVERIKYLIAQGVEASEILCITFTKKASYEMNLRLKNDDIQTHTFHGYCYQVLSAHKTFKIFEYHNEFSQEDILAVATYKNSLMQTKKPKIYQTYQKYLQDRNLLDYDDLMMESFKYIRKHPYKYIFVDEFQDTNLLQYKLLKLMLHKDVHICAVGDPDQSIYAFRGAKSALISRYLKDYHAVLLKLERNYRSNQYILDAANHLIYTNLNRYRKKLIGVRGFLKKPSIFIGVHDRLCAHIVYHIKKYKHFEAVVLYRNHYQVVYLKQLLHRHYLFGIKFYSFHESKGLEFRVVYMMGLEDLPFDKSNVYKHKEEERRLLFVGMTRAMDELYLYSTRKTSFLRQTKIQIHYV